MAETIRTLLVEDEEDIRFIFAISLKRHGGFSLSSYASGLDALAALDGTTNAFDLALVNLHLPSMTGVTFLQRLHQLPSFMHLPAILITASTSVRDLAGASDADVIGVINEPFDALSLGHDICQLLKNARPDRD